MRTSIFYPASRFKPTTLLIASLSFIFLWTGTVSRCDAGIVAFGDSLTDTGNLYLASGGAPFLPVEGSRFPSPPFSTGSASNGALWVDVLADRLGQPSPGAALSGGSNYSFIGALTGSQIGSPFGVPSMTQQVGLHLASTGGVASDDNLYVLWGGANDFFFGQFDPFLAVSNLSDQIQSLAMAGADEFLVPNLIPLNQTPSLAGTPDAFFAAAFSNAFNVSLSAEIASLRSDLGVTIHELDVATIFSEVNADPNRFGLTNLSDPAIQVDLATSVPVFPFDVVDNPNEYLWWDGVHPTAAAHEIIGERAAALVRPVPEPTSTVSWAVLAMGWLVIPRRRNRTRRFADPLPRHA